MLNCRSPPQIGVIREPFSASVTLPLRTSALEEGKEGREGEQGRRAGEGCKVEDKLLTRVLE